MIEALHPQRSNPPASDEELAQLEAAFGEPIPSQLRSLLRTANGAWIPDVEIPSERCPEVPGGGIGGEQLFSTDEIIKDREVYDGRISVDLLAFGSDNFGNALCIGLRGARRDKIYFWLHDEDVAGCLAMGMDVDPEGIHQNEYFVANSLIEFISLYAKSGTEGLTDRLMSDLNEDAAPESEAPAQKPNNAAFTRASGIIVVMFFSPLIVLGFEGPETNWRMIGVGVCLVLAGVFRALSVKSPTA